MLLDALKKSQQGTYLACLLDKPQDDGATQSEDDSDHTIDATQSEDAEIDRTLHVDASVLPHRRSLKLIKDICTRWNSTCYICYNDVYCFRSTLLMYWQRANMLI